MSSLSVKRFNWVRSPSAWESTQAWRSKQQEARSQFESASSAANSAFFGASIDLAAGLGAVAAKIASNRVQQQAIRAALNTLA